MQKFGEPKSMKCEVFAFLCITNHLTHYDIDDEGVKRLGAMYSEYAQLESIEISDKDLTKIKYQAEWFIENGSNIKDNIDIEMSIDITCEELVCGLHILGFEFNVPYHINKEGLLKAAQKIAEVIPEMRKRGYVLY